MPIVNAEEKRKREEEMKRRAAVAGTLPTPEEEQERKASAQAFIGRREKLRSKGASVEEATKQVTAEQEGLSFEQRTPQQAMGEQERFRQIAEQEKVFEQPVLEPIISPEQENLGVMLRIGKSLIPKSFTKAYKNIDTLGGLADFSGAQTIPQAEITMITADLQDAVLAETSVEIDTRIEGTEEVLIQNGIPLIGVVGAAVVGSAIAAPVKEFVGTDGQIASLELALSQYNEMITIPARSIDSGLEPQTAFDKLNRMEDGMLALEEQLKISSLTSPKVALALRGRGVEARLLKLKEKLQEGRRIVFQKMLQEGFGEVEVSESVRFLRQLQNERKEKI